jgi:hypothetical protein
MLFAHLTRILRLGRLSTHNLYRFRKYHFDEARILVDDYSERGSAFRWHDRIKADVAPLRL